MSRGNAIEGFGARSRVKEAARPAPPPKVRDTMEERAEKAEHELIDLNAYAKSLYSALATISSAIDAEQMRAYAQAILTVSGARRDAIKSGQYGNGYTWLADQLVAAKAKP